MKHVLSSLLAARKNIIKKFLISIVVRNLIVIYNGSIITKLFSRYRDECLYHRRPSEMRYTTLAAPSRSRLYAEEEEESVDEVEAVRYREPIKPTHITLNTYGHLKIDYTNSWNSLHRKIVSN